VSSQKLRAVIFDIGRVLVRVDVARAMSGLGTDPSLSPSETWAALEKDPRWPDWQEGRISPRDWHLHVAKRFGTSLTFEQFTEAWNRALDPKPIQDISLFEKLSKDYRLALLSNTDPIHVAHMEHSYDFFRFFSRRIYSCGVGASKPSPLIYREALRACKVQAGEAVYIDDILAYVEAAQRLGMAGIHYQSPDQLIRDLAGLGVKVR
jgi:HAD superfamily hydrolase (TIGR01509 family)